jgi:hypothetical protein
MATYEASVWQVRVPTVFNMALVAKIQQRTATAADLAAGGATQPPQGAHIQQLDAPTVQVRQRGGIQTAFRVGGLRDMRPATAKRFDHPLAGIAIRHSRRNAIGLQQRRVLGDDTFGRERRFPLAHAIQHPDRQAVAPFDVTHGQRERVVAPPTRVEECDMPDVGLWRQLEPPRHRRRVDHFQRHEAFDIGSELRCARGRGVSQPPESGQRLIKNAL